MILDPARSINSLSIPSDFMSFINALFKLIPMSGTDPIMDIDTIDVAHAEKGPYK